MRTNVRKNAAMLTIDPGELAQDPARSSENVKAALGEGNPEGYDRAAKTHLTPTDYNPTC